MKKSLILLCVFLYFQSFSQKTELKPNIVFILIDDLGYTDVGFMGLKYYETPNIDRLAKNRMIFTNAYTNASNCAPTRACLLTKSTLKKKELAVTTTQNMPL